MFGVARRLRDWWQGLSLQNRGQQRHVNRRRALGYDPLEQRSMLAVAPVLDHLLGYQIDNADMLAVQSDGTFYFSTSSLLVPGFLQKQLSKIDHSTNDLTLISSRVGYYYNPVPQISVTEVGSSSFVLEKTIDRLHQPPSQYSYLSVNGTLSNTVFHDNTVLSSLVNVNGTLFFESKSDVDSLRDGLWISDGTLAGTIRISSATDLGNLINLNGTLYFSSGDQLWKSNGTSSGTVMVADTNPAGSGTNLGLLTNVNGTLYFSGIGNSSGRALWKSDGTSAGTSKVYDIDPDASSFSQPFTAINNYFYFFGTDSTHGNELWKTDGTSSGTVMVRDIRPGAGSSLSTSFVRNPLASANGQVFFSADDGVHGLELWKTDGTSSGTVLVRDIMANGLSSSPSNLKEVDGVLYFSADNGTNGNELWSSDGTSSGTRIVADIVPGSIGSDPENLISHNGNLYFIAGGNIWMLYVPIRSEGSTVFVTGGSGDNQVNVTFTSAANYTVTIDGVSQSFDAHQFPNIVVDTKTGNDTVTTSTRFAPDLATLQQNLVTITNLDRSPSRIPYDITVRNAERVYVNGDSTDIATFVDSIADDYFWALPGYSLMTDPSNSYLTQAIGFGSIYARSTSGHDVSQLHGSATNQSYLSTLEFTQFAGNGVSYTTKGFWQNYAFSGGGYDTAVLNGSSDSEVVYELNGYSIMLSNTVHQYVVGFVDVTANSGGGANDVALLYDSPGNNLFSASSTTARMTGSGISNRANDFDQVHAYSSGGYDQAALEGSSGNDYFYGYETRSMLFASGVYFIQANNFSYVQVSLLPGDGNDTALLFDGASADTLGASGNTTDLYYASGKRIRLVAFDSVYASGVSGGVNRKQIATGLSYGLTLNGLWV